MIPRDPDAPHPLNLAERIRRLACGRTTLDVAQFQFIGFSEIRARYGEKWPEKRDRIQRIASEYIAKRIWQDDVLIPGADGFLVVFGQRTGLIADTAAERISKGLNDFFIGDDPEDADVRLEARRKEMNVEDLAGSFGDFDVVDNTPPAPREKPVNVPPGPLPASLAQIRFQPIWDVKRQALSNFLVTPVDPRTGQRVSGYHFESDPDAVRQHADLDELQLKASEDGLRRLFGAGRRSLVTVTLHVNSLQNTATLTRLLSVMSTFDRELMRYRIIRVSGIESGFPRIYLEDVCRMLRSRVANIAFGLNWQDPDIASVLKLQPTAVGFPLPPEATGLFTPRSELLARIRSAAEATASQNIPFFTDGAIGPDLALRMMDVGVNLIASPKIWPFRPTLGGAETWPASKLGPRPAQDSAA